MKCNLFLAAALARSASALQNGVGRLPAMGWNSWNAFHCDIEESKFLDAADKIVSLGLKDVGYEYVNIDDCWSHQYGRDNTTHRLVPDYAKFPDGINGTAGKIHDLGLKIGIYSSAGTETCAGWPASIGYEALDAETWAEWGIDYLKYDNCNVPSSWTDSCRGCVPDTRDSNGGPYPNGTCAGVPGTWCPAGYDYSESKTAERFRRMRDALQDTGRPILYSLCEWGEMDVQSWGNDTGNSWRSTQDISNNWDRIKELLNQNSFYLNNVNFWGHSDPDMLEVGNANLTLQEERSHFALWAAMKSPLLIGTDLANITQASLDVLKNKHLIAFNQDDSVGEPAMPYKWGTNPDWTFNASFPAEYWSGTFKDGRTLVLVFNPYDATQERSLVWGEIPSLRADGAYDVVDVWTGEYVGCRRGGLSVDVAAHDTAAFVVRAVW